MGQLIYSMIVSQDGYVAAADGDINWGQPGEDALAAINDEMSRVGTYLYGRRMYDMMAVWETDTELANDTPESGRFAALWTQADKLVFSRTLTEPRTARTRLRNEFVPAEIEELKRSSDSDITIDGPTLAAQALRLGLVDRVNLLVCPLVLGGGLPFWPDVRLELSLREVTRFDGGVVSLSYDVR